MSAKFAIGDRVQTAIHPPVRPSDPVPPWEPFGPGTVTYVTPVEKLGPGEEQTYHVDVDSANPKGKPLPMQFRESALTKE